MSDAEREAIIREHVDRLLAEVPAGSDELVAKLLSALMLYRSEPLPGWGRTGHGYGREFLMSRQRNWRGIAEKATDTHWDWRVLASDGKPLGNGTAPTMRTAMSAAEAAARRRGWTPP